MTRRNRSASVSLAALNISLSAAAVADVQSPPSPYGTPVPDARLQVSLPNPVPKAELYRRFESLARSAGFVNQKSTPWKEGTAPDALQPSAFDWNSAPESDRYPYRISLMWPVEAQDPSNFTFIFRKSDTSAFTARGWLQFFAIKEQYVDTLFPRSRITMKVQRLLHRRR